MNQKKKIPIAEHFNSIVYNNQMKETEKVMMKIDDFQEFCQVMML